MTNYWNQNGIPHKGWKLNDVIDIREEGQSEDETDYETCMMCGKEKIRFVHYVTHPIIIEEFKVGCICAEKMTGDYINPKKRERELKNKSKRRNNWLKKEWKQNINGNNYIIIKKIYLLIFLDRKTKKYKVKIGEIFGTKYFDSVEDAKKAAFEGWEYLNSKNNE